MSEQDTSIRVSHIGICVSDLDASMRFYCDGLGFRPSDAYEMDSEAVPALPAALEVAGEVEMTSQFLVLDHLRVELLHYARPRPTGTPSTSRGLLGLTHLALRVRDLASVRDRLLECGGTEVPNTAQNVGIEIVVIADPDGTRVELMQYL